MVCLPEMQHSAGSLAIQERRGWSTCIVALSGLAGQNWCVADELPCLLRLVDPQALAQSIVPVCASWTDYLVGFALRTCWHSWCFVDRLPGLWLSAGTLTHPAPLPGSRSSA